MCQTPGDSAWGIQPLRLGLLASCAAAVASGLKLPATDHIAHRDVPAPPRVALPCGEVEGTWDSGIASFRGIPYGAAPVGSARWKPAAPAACWGPKVLPATRNGHICYQGGMLPNEDEDCLNLNLFAPKAALGTANDLPVLVWLFGGMNSQGSATSYGAIEHLVRHRPCILIAPNYRVGMLGFLALRELSEADPRGVSGNYGITDQQLALEWVRQNVRAFGGNPNKVTLMGHSSGGTNVLAHLASPGSHGLFHRAIALSASGNVTVDQASKERQDREMFLWNTKCRQKADVLGCLYRLHPRELTAAMHPCYTYFGPLYGFPVDQAGLASRECTQAHVDGVTVASPAEEAFRAGRNDVPVLMSGMQAEMDAFPVARLRTLTNPQLQTWLTEKLEPTYGTDVPVEVFDMYRNYSQIGADYAIQAAAADAGMSCALRALALGSAAGRSFRSPVYWGLVAGAPSRPFGWKSSRLPFHQWDVIAATDTWDVQGLPYLPSGEDRRFGAMLRDQWFHLAVHGELPSDTWKPAQSWPPGTTAGSLVGKRATKLVDNLKSKECSFWESIGVGRNWWWIN